VLEDVRHHATPAFKREGDMVVVIGNRSGVSLAGSEYLEIIHGRVAGKPPEPDLAAEKKTADLVRNMIRSGLVDTAHDVSGGGELVALAEMALAGGLGIEYEEDKLERMIAGRVGGRADVALFGEEPGGFVVAVSLERWDELGRAGGGAGLRPNRNCRRGQVQDRRSRRRELAGSQGSVRAGPLRRSRRSGDKPLSVDKVNIEEKLALFDEQWKPKIAGELNGQYVKLVKFSGPFVWHHHDEEDELFLVVKGRFRMEFRDRSVWIEEGEFIVVPRGVEHRPVAEEEAHVLLFEPASTLNTGNVRDERTVAELDRI
jgi:mannose-6-phosphate isomerase-like protein (cupin superfamily)